MNKKEAKYEIRCIMKGDGISGRDEYPEEWQGHVSNDKADSVSNQVNSAPVTCRIYGL